MDGFVVGGVLGRTLAYRLSGGVDGHRSSSLFSTKIPGFKVSSASRLSTMSNKLSKLLSSVDDETGGCVSPKGSSGNHSSSSSTPVSVRL